MGDFFGKVTDGQDPLKKLASKIPQFGGYIERQNRRAADKLLRETVAQRFEEQIERISRLQTDMINDGMIEWMDDIGQATRVMRTFVDKIRHAAYGYSGFFDAVKINEEELAQLYAFDNAFFDMIDQIAHAVDNLAASMGDADGLKAAIRNVTQLAREALTTLERRYEIINGAE